MNSRILILCLSLLSFQLFAQVERIDSSFGVNGKAWINVDWFDELMDIETLDNGKAVILFNAGHSDSLFDMNFGLMLINEHGSIDSSFGQNGTVVQDFYNFEYSSVVDLLQLDDGRLIVLGKAFNYSDQTIQPFCTAMFSSTGIPDSSFGINGQLQFSFLGPTNDPKTLALQQDGKILTAGAAFDTTAVHQELPAVARINQDGSLDSTFAKNGKLALNYTTGQNAIDSFSSSSGGARHLDGGTAHNLAVLPNGKIVFVGSYFNSTNYECSIVRLLSDGTPDSSFFGDGFYHFDFEAGSNNYLLQSTAMPNGDMMVLPFIDNAAVSHDFSILNLMSNGQFDIPYEVDFNTLQDVARGLLATTAGDLFVVGSSSADSNFYTGYIGDYLSILKLEGNNAWNLDPEFGDNGRVRFNESGFGQIQASVIKESADQSMLVGGLVEIVPGTFETDLFILKLTNDSIATNIGTDRKDKGIRLFPNPASSTVEIGLPENWKQGFPELEVFDWLGKKQPVEFETSIYFNHLRIDLSAWASGCYIVRLSSGRQIQSTKLFVQKRD